MTNSHLCDAWAFKASQAMLLSLAIVTCTFATEAIKAGDGESVNPVERTQTKSTFTFRNGETFQRTLAIVDGVAIAEGDIIFGHAHSILQTRSRHANGLNNTIYGKTWPNGLIPYRISPDLSDASTSNIHAAIEHWNDTDTITLVERTAANASAFPHYIDFVDANRCASWIGFQEDGPQSIYTGDKCSTGSMIHEIGHALGLLHEHTRPDRDRYVKINSGNITEDMDINFEIMSGGVQLGPYDYGSIMHYGAYFFSKNGQPTIEAIEATSAKIGQRDGTSQGDRDAIATLYQSNLSLVASTSDPTVTAGEQMEVSMFITNNSPVGANTLQISLPIPPDSQLLSYSSSSWICMQQPPAQVLCETPVLSAGADTSVTVNLTATSQPGTMQLDTTLSSRTVDTNNTDNRDSTSVTVLPNPDAPSNTLELTSKKEPATEDSSEPTVASNTTTLATVPPVPVNPFNATTATPKLAAATSAPESGGGPFDSRFLCLLALLVIPRLRPSARVSVARPD